MMKPRNKPRATARQGKAKARKATNATNLNEAETPEIRLSTRGQNPQAARKFILLNTSTIISII